MASASAVQKTRACDNHPDVEAWLVSDLGGAVQEIALCKDCTPPHLAHFRE